MVGSGNCAESSAPDQVLSTRRLGLGLGLGPGLGPTRAGAGARGKARAGGSSSAGHVVAREQPCHSSHHGPYCHLKTCLKSSLGSGPHPRDDAAATGMSSTKQLSCVFGRLQSAPTARP